MCVAAAMTSTVIALLDVTLSAAKMLPHKSFCIVVAIQQDNLFRKGHILHNHLPQMDNSASDIVFALA